MPSPETSYEDQRALPTESSGPPIAASVVIGKARFFRSPGQLLRLGVSVALCLALGFVALSNYLGWTARVEVTSVEQVCEGGACQQRIRLRGSQRKFLLEPAPPLSPGDYVDVEGTCTPGCKLAVVAAWQSATGQRVSLASQAGKQ